MALLVGASQINNDVKKYIENSHEHSLENLKFFQFKEFSCTVYSQIKLIKPSPTGLRTKFPTFLEHIKGDIYGPINPYMNHLDIL